LCTVPFDVPGGAARGKTALRAFIATNSSNPITVIPYAKAPRTTRKRITTAVRYQNRLLMRAAS
jgi:hypothetical protein